MELKGFYSPRDEIGAHGRRIDVYSIVLSIIIYIVRGLYIWT